MSVEVVVGLRAALTSVEEYLSPSVKSGLPELYDGLSEVESYISSGGVLDDMDQYLTQVLRTVVNAIVNHIASQVIIIVAGATVLIGATATTLTMFGVAVSAAMGAFFEATGLTIIPDDIDFSALPEGALIKSQNNLVMGDDIVTTRFNDTVEAYGGHDYIKNSGGSDLIYAGDGVDTIDYSEMSPGVSLEMSVSQSSVLHGNDVDTIYGAEHFVLTAGNDVVSIVSDGPAGSAPQFSVEGGEGHDTIYFDESYADGVHVALSTGYSGYNGGWTINATNFEDGFFTIGDDSIVGNTADNLLYLSSGTDTVHASRGDDTIYADCTDTDVVDGGEGRDVLIDIGDASNIATGEDGYRCEIVIAGSGNDTISIGSYGAPAVSGGGGDDTIEVNLNAGGGPVILWGGAGSDTINISVNTAASDPEGGTVGIFVVNVDNISEENFHNLTYDMLGMGDDFEWSEIDVVLVNPDSSDRINLKDNVGTQRLGEQTITREGWFYPGTGENGEEIPPQHYYTTSFAGYEGWIEADEWAVGMNDPLSDYRQSFLSGYDGTVYGPANTLVETWVTEYRNDSGTYVAADTGTDYYAEFTEIFGNFGVGGSGSDGEIDTEYDLSGADAVSDWVGDKREHYFYGFTTDLGENMDPITAPTGWFMLGGHLSGDSIVLGDTSGGGVIHVQIPDTGDMVMV